MLYVVSDVFTGRFGMLISAIFTMLWSTVGACAMAGAVRIRWGRLVRLLLVMMILVGAGILGVRGFFTSVVTHEYIRGQRFGEMDLMTPRVHAKILDGAALEAPPGHFDSTLDRIQSRGVLRVGYRKDELPFSFRNTHDELVGHDMDLAHILARDLDVQLELVAVTRTQTARLLSNGAIDIVMSGVVVTVDRATQMGFSLPYMDLTLAFVVPDHRRNAFSTRESIKTLSGVTVVIPDLPQLTEYVEEYLPDAKIVVLESPQQFLNQKGGAIDAMVFSAEAGSAWSLVYPRFSVAVPQPDVIRVPVAFPLTPGDERMRAFLDTWIQLKRRNGTLGRLYNYWILGRKENSCFSNPRSPLEARPPTAGAASRARFLTA